MIDPQRLALILAVPAVIVAVAGWIVAQPVWPLGRGASRPDGADPDRLRRHVRALSEDFLPRDAEHPKNLDRAAAYISRHLKGLGAEVSEQAFAFKEYNQRNKLIARGPYRNVIARFGPPSGEVFVVGAHYDAYGGFPGADDNASGVAGLLELARLLGKDPPLKPVELVAYTLEEPPYFAGEQMGSERHAAALRKAGARVLGMISLEMIGVFQDSPGSQHYPWPILRLFYPSAGNFIAVVGSLADVRLTRRVKRAMRRASPLEVRSINGPASIPGIDYSDHRSYWSRGWSAVMVGDTAFYRHDRYHTASDTAGTLDYPRMAQVVDGVFAAVREMTR